jgi:glycosyltransferase involved in cell wall biosynthesis
MSKEPTPILTIIVPVRNEADHIRECLDTILRDAPREGIEVLVVDGMSDDGTAERVEEVALRDRRVRLLRNEKRFVPRALNIGLAAARGRYIGRVDGHCRVERGYFQTCIDILEESGCECAGGVLINEGRTARGRAIASAMSSRIAVGNASFRTGTSRETKEVDTLAFGIYRKEVFQSVGTFDEELVRNQDDEFNFRVVRSGGRILLTSATRIRYFARDSLRHLARQYFQYGYWKIKVIKKHGRIAAWRHLVPPTFILVLALLLILSPFSTTALLGLAAILVFYLLVLGLESARLSSRTGSRGLLILSAIAAIHFSYGWGILSSLVRGIPGFSGSGGTRHTDLTR